VIQAKFETMADFKEASINRSTLSDQATSVDSLGFEPYVQAIAEFLVDKDTKPPLTLSIEGEWGSGKSSFMKQLQGKISELEKNRLQHRTKIVWFNPWRHDKAEALWAAFALSFVEQITKTQDISDIFPTMWGHAKLLRSRLKLGENWLELLQGLCLVLFIGATSLSIPVLFVTVGPNAINQFSTQAACLFESDPKKEEEKKDEKGERLKSEITKNSSKKSSNPIKKDKNESSPSNSVNTEKSTGSTNLDQCKVSGGQQWLLVILKGLLFGGGISLILTNFV
jgi:hypothetical protein